MKQNVTKSHKLCNKNVMKLHNLWIYFQLKFMKMVNF